ncbi:alpha/beta fold hydrolase [Nocardia stercoris]|uniref:Alpha/beta hydrolase n=1 Tax=Nocardia stercoris TaxID=2483361 RepID=A0A3M2L4I8_9NOCA|nr:alpha/beta hydrolase [Nocardia stercoris]RMI32557.1 alpha/beta hydrolase [Nocardia stercoris]
MASTWAEWVAGGERVDLDGSTVFVRQDGPPEGRPVTLLHGYPTSSHDWAPILPALVDAGCRVTVLDFLGFGASAKPYPHEYRLTAQADLVERVWEHFGGTETALVAHDYGVSVGQELLARDPARITRMAWLNGGLYVDLYRPLAIQRAMIGPAGKLLGRLMTERSFRLTLDRILGRPVPVAELHQMWLAMTAGGGLRVQWALNRYHAERRAQAQRWQRALESYPGPTLFVWGPADPISGGHLLPRLRERLPRAEFVVLDDEPATGHYPQVENPAAVGSALAAFLA